MKKGVIRWAAAIIIFCIAIIVVTGTLDWGTKHITYLQQRAALYNAIQAGEEYEGLKRTVSYLQGAATRTLNNLKSTCLYLAPLLIAAFYIYRKEGSGK